MVKPSSPEVDAAASTGRQAHRGAAPSSSARPIAPGPRLSRPTPPNVTASGAAYRKNARAAPESAASRAKARSAATKWEAGPVGESDARGGPARSAGRVVAAPGESPMTTKAASFQVSPSGRHAAM